MPSQPGSSNWKIQMPSYTPSPNWQPPIPSHPGDAGLCDPKIISSLALVQDQAFKSLGGPARQRTSTPC
ncbi:hypothetical protein Tco_1221834 [Tanacetum coccineum]